MGGTKVLGLTGSTKDLEKRLTTSWRRGMSTSGVLLVVVMAYASVAWGKQDGYP